MQGVPGGHLTQPPGHSRVRQEVVVSLCFSSVFLSCTRHLWTREWLCYSGQLLWDHGETIIAGHYVGTLSDPHAQDWLLLSAARRETSLEGH